MRRALGLALAASIWTPAMAATSPPEDFGRNCATCHTIGGGRLTGPDLKDVTQRRARGWLRRYLPDPKAMLDGGDPTMAELYRDYHVLMPSISGMTAERVEGLLDLIDAESKLSKSRFAGSELIARPLAASDVAEGEAVFTGRRRLKNGGPACVSCHSAGAMGGLGGGFLGPDLTAAYSRLGGTKALAAWLVNPGSPTMSPVFARRPLDPEEILPLVAFLKDTAERGRPADSIARLAFLILGLVGATAMFVVLDTIWGGRFRSARRELVERGVRAEGRDA